jgi:hypothetical protein
MDAEHSGAAEVAPLRRRFFTVGWKFNFCFDAIHDEER